MNLRQNEPLRLHTTLRTGGPARFFVEAQSEEDLREALRFARARGVDAASRRRGALPLFVLGGGSNVLAGDAGFDGLVVKMANRGQELRASQGQSAEVVAAAGESWDALVAFAVEHGLCGLENLSLIPGTVGGAVVGNIGAYGVEVKDTLLWVEALDRRTGNLRRFTRADCGLEYRRSWFKTAEGSQFIVTRAAFGLSRAGRPDTRYRELADYLAACGLRDPTPAEVREAVSALRRRKLPDVAQIGTAGSFFKNPVLAPARYRALAARYPGLPGYPEPDGRVKVPLGWILDKVCGLRGVRRGPVGTHPGQALVIVNQGGSAAQVTALAGEMARQVQALTGIEVEWEVERLEATSALAAPQGRGVHAA